MQVRVIAMLEEPAAAACTARPIRAGGADAQEPGRKVEPQRRLAHRGWPREEHRMRGAPGQHRPDRREGDRMSDRPEHAGHAWRIDRGQPSDVPVDAVLRVVRRRGVAAASGSAVAVDAASSVLAAALARRVRRAGVDTATSDGASSAAAAVLRVEARRLGAADVAVASPASAADVAADAALVDAFRVVVRRFGVASVASAASAPAAGPASVADAAVRRVRPRVLVCAVIASTSSASPSGGVVTRGASSTGRASPLGFERAICARTSSSSSGGTSLQGSDDPRLPPDGRPCGTRSRSRLPPPPPPP